MTADVTKYAYRVLWSEDDGEYVGTVAEFPTLSWLDGTQVEAFEGIVGLVDEVASDMETSGEPIPQPYALRAPHQLTSGPKPIRVTPDTRDARTGR